MKINDISNEIANSILSEEAGEEYIKARVLDELILRGVINDITSQVIKKLEEKGVKVNKGWL